MPYNRFKKKFVEHFEEVLKTKTGVRSIAFGFAVGTFISILPTPGFNILIGLLVILIFPHISKYALFTSYFVFNGLVKIPIYISAVYLGEFILNNGNEIIWTGNFIDTTLLLSKSFIVGVAIINITLTFLSYHLVYHIVKYYRNKKKHHLEISD